MIVVKLILPFTFIAILASEASSDTIELPSVQEVKQRDGQTDHRPDERENNNGPFRYLNDPLGPGPKKIKAHWDTVARRGQIDITGPKGRVRINITLELNENENGNRKSSSESFGSFFNSQLGGVTNSFSSAIHQVENFFRQIFGSFIKNNQFNDAISAALPFLNDNDSSRHEGHRLALSGKNVLNLKVTFRSFTYSYLYFMNEMFIYC